MLAFGLDERRIAEPQKDTWTLRRSYLVLELALTPGSSGYGTKVIIRPRPMSQPAISVDKIRFNEQGLVPAIAQDYLDGTVLMMAWMNAEALQKTMDSGEVHYWSRSRQELWHKGANVGPYSKAAQPALRL